MERGELDGIAVARLNRLARSRKVTYDTLDRLRAAAPGDTGGFGSHDEDWNFATPEGEMMLALVVAQGQFESAKKAEATRYARDKRLREGKPWGGKRTWGYDLDEQGYLIPNEQKALVREAFRRCAAGEPVQRIATLAAGGQAGEGAGLRRGDQHPLPAGCVDQRGLHRRAARRRAARQTQASDHRGQRLWANVQARLGHRPQPSARVDSALGGIVRCWHCRHVLAANWSLSKRHGKRRAYRCRNERCGRWTFALEDDLLPLAEEAFFARVEDIEKQQMATNGKVIRKLEKERQEIQQGISNLVQLATRRSSRLDAIDEQLTTEEQRLEQVERRLAMLDSTPALPKLTRLTREWPEMPAEERKRLFMLVFGAIVVQAPAKRRDHSVPLRERIAFLPLAEAASLPRPGRLPNGAPPQHTSFPPLDEGEFWQLSLGYQRQAVVEEFKSWLAVVKGGRWGPPAP